MDLSRQEGDGERGALRCAAVRRMIPGVAAEDGAPRHRGVWAHLRGCPRCRSEFAGFVGAAKALRGLLRAPAPAAPFFAELERTTLAAVAREPMPRRASWGRSGRRLLVAAGCVVCAIAGHWLASRAPAAPGAALLDRRPMASYPTRAAIPATSERGWLVPVGFTPSRQGLRGQQHLCRDAWCELLPTAPVPPR